MWLHKGSLCLHQLPCRHLGDVNHAPSLVTGFAELEYLFLGDGFHVSSYCEESFPSYLSVEISSSLRFSSSSSSGSSHQFPSGGGGGCTWRYSSLQFGAVFCGTGSLCRIFCATLSFLLRSFLVSCVGCFLWLGNTVSPSSLLLRSVGATAI